MTFADQLKAVRKRLGCSQAAACLLLPDLPVRTLQAWECGQQTPPKWAQQLVLWALGGAPYEKKKLSARNARGAIASKKSKRRKAPDPKAP